MKNARRVFVLLAYAFVIVALLVVLNAYLIQTWAFSFWLIYDDEHPDSRLVHAALARAELDNRNELTLDLTGINGGQWSVLCLIGGYGRPVDTIDHFARKHGVHIKSISKIWPWLWVGGVPESDSLSRTFRQAEFYGFIAFDGISKVRKPAWKNLTPQ